ncbi:predicted protein [Arabidopsis lyrata subsp. lyrata]|uniref:Predicted protein n=1 Tax=Arabidopsis lyrata subsp. lyrata TaxID=81972 RepID=D7LVI1_ARALL|nr:predicted protein [Arabidopsis lyrata subsp. lyrata]
MEGRGEMDRTKTANDEEEDQVARPMKEIDRLLSCFWFSQCSLCKSQEIVNLGFKSV